LRELSHDFKGERKSILSHDILLVHVFREDDVQTTKCSEHREQNGGSSSRIAAILIAFRVAAKGELDPYFSIFLFNDVMHSTEIDEAWSCVLVSLSLLAACTNGFVASLARSPRYVDAKLQKGFASRIGEISHRGCCRNLDSTVSSRWLLWKSFEEYIENDMGLATQCDDLHWRWLHEGKPVGHTGTLLREGLYESRAGNAPQAPFVLA